MGQPARQGRSASATIDQRVALQSLDVRPHGDLGTSNRNGEVAQGYHSASVDERSRMACLRSAANIYPTRSFARPPHQHFAVRPDRVLAIRPEHLLFTVPAGVLSVSSVFCRCPSIPSVVVENASVA